jgi:hypothetical protein
VGICSGSGVPTGVSAAAFVELDFRDDFLELVSARTDAIVKKINKAAAEMRLYLRMRVVSFAINGRPGDVCQSTSLKSLQTRAATIAGASSRPDKAMDAA